ncbi:MAG: hypothetical protein ABIR18_04265 [Chitinophagaceae bacterium]
MKKLIIGAIVGGILLFIWPTLSWTVLNLHGKEYQKAPNQDALLSTLSGQFTEDGQYYMPTVEQNASSEDREKLMESMKGKPWAVISYHKAYNANMVMNIVRGLLVAIVSVLFVCWVLMKNTSSSVGGTFVSSILIGLAGYLFIPYSGYIWFENPGAMTSLVDTLISWGIVGVWLGWWLNRK